MYLQLEAERANTAGAEERLARIVTQKADLEQQVKDLEERFSQEEESAQEVCCASLLPLFSFLFMTFFQTPLLDYTGTICNSSFLSPNVSFGEISLSKFKDS